MSEAATDEKPAIAAAINVQDGKFLLVQRRVSEGELSWQFPVGALEASETFDQAAVREAEEEAGLTVEAVKMLGERVHPKTGRLMGYVACEVKSATSRTRRNCRTLHGHRRTSSATVSPTASRRRSRTT